MRGPDGTVYPMRGVFREVVEPERLVFTGAALNQDGNSLFEALNTVTFAGQGAKTELTLQAQVVESTAEGAPYLEGMGEGWKQTIDRLEAYVARA